MLLRWGAIYVLLVMVLTLGALAAWQQLVISAATGNSSEAARLIETLRNDIAAVKARLVESEQRAKKAYDELESARSVSAASDQADVSAAGKLDEALRLKDEAVAAGTQIQKSLEAERTARAAADTEAKAAREAVAAMEKSLKLANEEALRLRDELSKATKAAISQQPPAPTPPVKEADNAAPGPAQAEKGALPKSEPPAVSEGPAKSAGPKKTRKAAKPAKQPEGTGAFFPF